MNQSPTTRVLVTDFDGTMTRHDFYALVTERLLPPGCPDYWSEYTAGRLTHFETLRAIFKAAEGGVPALVGIAQAMELDPHLREDVDALAAAGWDVVVASAGCNWYIQILLGEAGVPLEVHASPGHIENGRLVMELPEHSRFLSREMGIDKAAVVRAAQTGGRTVAFAGDGNPDVAPALLVPPARRFARGALAAELSKRGEAYRPFGRWSDVARALLSDPRDGV